MGIGYGILRRKRLAVTMCATPQVESRERAGARWNDSRAPNWARESFRQQADSRRQSIEAQENRVLDFWLTPGFYKAAAASVVVLLAVLLLSGPP